MATETLDTITTDERVTSQEDTAALLSQLGIVAEVANNDSDGKQPFNSIT